MPSTKTLLNEEIRKAKLAGWTVTHSNHDSATFLYERKFPKPYLHIILTFLTCFIYAPIMIFVLIYRESIRYKTCSVYIDHNGKAVWNGT